MADFYILKDFDPSRRSNARMAQTGGSTYGPFDSPEEALEWYENLGRSPGRLDDKIGQIRICEVAYTVGPAKGLTLERASR